MHHARALPRACCFAQHRHAVVRVQCTFCTSAAEKLASTYIPSSLCFMPQGFDEYMNLVLDEAEEVSGALRFC